MCGGGADGAAPGRRPWRERAYGAAGPSNQRSARSADSTETPAEEDARRSAALVPRQTDEQVSRPRNSSAHRDLLTEAIAENQGKDQPHAV